MKTSVIEVRDMLSVLSVLGVEERIAEVPGVESVTVNYAAGSATVRYDETRLELADIKSGVRRIGNEADDAPGADSAAKGHGSDHAAPGAPPAPAAPKSPPDSTAAAGGASAGAAQESKAAPSTPPKPGPAAPAPAAPKPAPGAAPAGEEQKGKAPGKS